MKSHFNAIEFSLRRQLCAGRHKTKPAIVWVTTQSAALQTLNECIVNFAATLHLLIYVFNGMHLVSTDNKQKRHPPHSAKCISLLRVRLSQLNAPQPIAIPYPFTLNSINETYLDDFRNFSRLFFQPFPDSPLITQCVLAKCIATG